MIVRQIAKNLGHITVYKKVDASRPDLFEVLDANDNEVIRVMADGPENEGIPFFKRVELLLSDLQERFPAPSAASDDADDALPAVAEETE
jgi:hypothetical protein